MKCRIAKKLVFDFIDGLDDDTKRLGLEKHLAQCSECDKFASQLTRSMDLLHRAPRETTGDNFAWKVRLKLNQERNAIQERGVSYGALIRKWNVRYVATAVAAAAVVLVVGLYTVRSGLILFPQDDRQLDRTAYGQSEADSFASANEEKVVGHPTSSPATEGFQNFTDRMITRRDPGVGRYPVSQGAPSGQYSSPMLGLIDRPGPMSAAEFDSLMNDQLNGLTPEEQRQYLNQYIILLQRHMMRVMINRSNR